jgi:hypothetical protein
MATRLSLVALVLVIGVGTAMLFRKQPTQTSEISRGTPDPLLLRKSPAAASRPATVVRASDDAVAESPPKMSVLRPLLDSPADDRRVLPPPDLENSFARPLMPIRHRGDAADDRAGDADTIVRLPNADPTNAELRDEPRPARTRVVVDGDSLRSLAKRYLGSSERYMEIYEANRDVLASPDLLEIGMQLKIPSNKPVSVDRGDMPAQQPIENNRQEKMVPIKD